MVKEKVEIITTMVDRISGKTKKINKTIRDMGGGIQKATTQTYAISKGQRTLMSTTNQTTRGLRKFKFEWLSVMFAGMALYKVFGNIIKAQLELWGVTEGFGAMMTLALIGPLEVLSDTFWKLFEQFTKLDPKMQEVIGWFLAITAAVGLFTMVLGMVMLAAGGITNLLGPGFLAGAIIKLKALFVGLGATIGLVVGIIIAIVIGMYLAWKENFINMREVVSKFIEGVKQFFSGLIGIIKGVMNILIGIFTGDFELIKKGIIGIFVGLWNVLAGTFKALFNLITAIGIGAVKIIWNVLKVVINSVVWLINSIGWLAGKVGKLFGGRGGPVWRIPSLQLGGVVPETGAYMLHRGETVTPAGKTEFAFSPTVTIYANISSDMDIRTLGERLSSIWAEELKSKMIR